MDSSYISCNNLSIDKLRPTVTTRGSAGCNLPRMTKRVGDKDNTPTNFLKAWRLARGFTQEEFADLAGTTKATISRTESRKQAFMPAAQKLYADKLGTHPSVLLSRPPTADEAPPTDDRPRARKLPTRGAKRRRS